MERKLISREEFGESFFKERSDMCAFCNVSESEFIHTFEHWNWQMAKSPYWSAFTEIDGEMKRVASHTLLLPKRHIKSISELEPNEFMELQGIYSACLSIYEQLHLKYKKPDNSFSSIEQYLIIARFREKIRQPFEEHLHIHFIPEGIDMLRPSFDKDASLLGDTRTLLEIIDQRGIFI